MATTPVDRRTGKIKKSSQHTSHARDFSAGFFVKLVLMLLVDALLIYLMLLAWGADQMGVLIGLAAVFIFVNWAYFSPSARIIPMKYLAPGLVFLFIFQVFVVAYTGIVAFTNYGEGHNSTKEQAISALMMQNVQRVPDSEVLPLSVVRQGDTLGFAVIDGDEVKVGTAEDPLAPVDGATFEERRILEVPGWDVLALSDLGQIQRQVVDLRVPVSDLPEDGFIGTQDARNGYQYRSTLAYDREADTMTAADGTVYTPNDRGQFQAEDGRTLNVGWRVNVGFENFTTAFADSRYAGPFWQVLMWNFAFAFLSVATTFLLGLGLAILLNNARLQGKKIYRTLMILPYAFPSFMTALLFAGMMNRRFGFINVVLFGGAEVPWLTDPWLAKLSLILVNLWMGFPYMFLVCTGALQSIPNEMLEAARIDGASKFRTWRSVTMPLLFIAVAPLLIASFAFNFNNFSLVKMLTNGGPRFPDASVPIGQSDILISMVYNISGLDGTAPRNYGLASALSIVIFLIVAVISAISFRKTQSLEDIN
ncbi:MAG TPA: ABC transporter permease subunit [Actinomycetales bacterium]|nr:ABC transporter permease subunit [Actinomycetales bacterium]